uniref:RNA-directed RNA polymerase n=1 Tax=Mawson virus TaxID=2707241 RepID=A0A6H0DKB6_9VIRU|nr:MAG: RNA-dependent RNA polymerase [Mawson virus]
METSIITILNQEIANAVNDLPTHDLHFDDKPDSTTVEHYLQFYRAKKKFSVPADIDEHEMRQACWEETLSNERRISELFDSVETTEWIRGNSTLLRRIKLEIGSILQSFSIDWGADPGFGPGEQFETSGGKTSEFDKFAEHEWTCTEANFELFARAMYANRFTRRLVWKRCKKRYPVDAKYLSNAEHRFTYFSMHLRLVTKFVLGNRFSSVEKDNTKRRGICPEGLGNLYVQKAIGIALKRSQALSGNNLWTGKSDHSELISDDGVSTIDFSSASDSIHFGWIKLLFPPWFVSLISKSRSANTFYEGAWYKVVKVSSMGNGFTFELMSLLLLAVCRALKSKVCRVYGDDVIIENNLAPLFIEVIGHLGFQVNESKSFVASEFRESCGAFFYRKYLMSFDIKYITNPLEARATLNKILLLSESNYWFAWLWKKLIAHVPKSARGPVPEKSYQIDNLSAYYWDSGHTYTSNGGSRWLENLYSRPDFSIQAVQTVQPVVVETRIEDSSIHQFVSCGLRLKNRIAPKRTLRIDESGKKFQSVTIFVDRDGFLMTAQRYKQLRRNESEYLKGIFETEVLTRHHWSAWHLN